MTVEVDATEEREEEAPTPSPPPDVVYVVRRGEDNEPLRYSLRSLAHVPHGTVWIAGYTPTWVRGVRSIDAPQTGRSRFDRSQDNLAAACAHPEVSDSFVLFNDDFYAMEPLGEVPMLHRGRLADVIGRPLGGKRRRSPLAYMQTAMETGWLLTDLGVPDPLSYDLHLPMPIDKGRMGETIEIARRKDVPAGHIRTLYGNYHQVGGQQAEDVKPREGARDPRIPDGPWLSSGDRSWRGKLGAHIRAALPTPSPYEEA